MTVYDPTLCTRLRAEAAQHKVALRDRCACANVAFKCSACPRCMAIAWFELNGPTLAEQLGAACARVRELEAAL